MPRGYTFVRNGFYGVECVSPDLKTAYAAKIEKIREPGSACAAVKLSPLGPNQGNLASLETTSGKEAIITFEVNGGAASIALLKLCQPLEKCFESGPHNSAVCAHVQESDASNSRRSGKDLELPGRPDHKADLRRQQLGQHLYKGQGIHYV